jgi:hypothetical protein
MAGVPPGGTAGQVLAKETDGSFETCWEDATGGGGAITINDQSGESYTLGMVDQAALVRMTSDSTNDVTIPPNSSVPFPVGSRVSIRQAGAGLTTLVAGDGVTLNNPGTTLALAGQNATIAVVQVAADEWDVIGDMDGVPPISYVNGTGGYHADGASAALSFSLEVQAGNCILISISTYADADAPVIAGETGDTFNLIGHDTSTNACLFLYLGKNLHAHADYSIVVNPKPGGSGTLSYPSVCIDQYKCAGTVDVAASFVTSNGPGGLTPFTADTPAVSPSQVGIWELVYGVATIDNSGASWHTADSGFLFRNNCGRYTGTADMIVKGPQVNLQSTLAGIMNATNPGTTSICAAALVLY